MYRDDEYTSGYTVSLGQYTCEQASAQVFVCVCVCVLCIFIMCMCVSARARMCMRVFCTLDCPQLIFFS